MEIVNQYPPNYEDICLALPEVTDSVDALFPYEGKIYNPYGIEIGNDILLHESVHDMQQKDAGGSDAWWRRYLSDWQFRLDQEIEAYGEQFAFAKKAIEAAAENAADEGKVLEAGKNNLIRFALENMAHQLSSAAYGNMISRGEAEAKIRNYSKK